MRFSWDVSNEFNTNPNRSSSRNWIATVLIAALVGSGTTLLMVPTLLKTNLLNLSAVEANAGGNVESSRQSVTINVNSDIVQAVNKVKPAVVTVVNIRTGSGLFSPKGEREAGKGSGVLIDSQGRIVTNNHVVDGATEVEVVLNNESVKAKVLGTDPYTDLAVLQVPASKTKDIQPVALGKSEALQIGEPAIAIGNPLGEFDQTVTVGVISAKKRSLPIRDKAGNVVYEQTVLQTDAAINPGNSGGALINIAGELIGINSAKIASSGVEGLGFAIPIDEAKPIIDQLISYGKVIRPALGVTISGEVEDIPENYRGGIPVEHGVVVNNASGPAEKAGIRKGDVIVQIDNKEIKTFVDLRQYLFSKKPGDTVQVTFYRQSEEKTVKVTLQELPQ
ncbi:S1C family serine protease [Effusibacillus consociatus]|uniref:S1C family serine protease n=1 Tax=Effusibacillus consociatus TaxID=1117041 RepID=A0ABV9Q5X4_9BACL